MSIGRRLGAVSFVAFIVQLITSELVGHFGLLGVARSPNDMARLTGPGIISAGIIIIEVGNLL